MRLNPPHRRIGDESTITDRGPRGDYGNTVLFWGEIAGEKSLSCAIRAAGGGARTSLSMHLLFAGSLTATV